ncbi:MAG TPA: hypothetical protein VNA04_13115 [Thermoanaerobaculia bacterium]|nr:hypothetical protein [Thermoanaerobaculia bacterium]
MTWRAFGVLLAALLLGPAAAGATTPTRRPLIVTQQNHALADAEDCQRFHTSTITSLPHSARSEEKKDVRLETSKHLTVKMGSEGGVSVRGWDRPFARLTVCKSAVALTAEQARRALARIDVAVTRDEIIARGPEPDETQTWWVNMILWVPRTAHLDLTATNGGIAIRGMTSHVTARATNGGISIAGCAGEHHLETKNGGISIDKVSGSVHAVTEAGPISLKLRDLIVPPLEAITDEQGEIYCNLKNCSDGRGDWAANRKRLRIGGQSVPSIRLTSLSADIMIAQVR